MASPLALSALQPEAPIGAGAPELVVERGRADRALEPALGPRHDDGDEVGAEAVYLQRDRELGEHLIDGVVLDGCRRHQSSRAALGAVVNVEEDGEGRVA